MEFAISAQMRAQQQAMQQIEQIVHAAFGEVLRRLAPGYKATVLFTFSGRPDRDIVMAQADLPEVLTALMAKATPAVVAAVTANASNVSNVAEEVATARLDKVRLAMRLLPRTPTTDYFRRRMEEALGAPVEIKATPQPNVPDVSSDGPRDGADVTTIKISNTPPEGLTPCPNCGSDKITRQLGANHWLCEECGNDLTECAR